MTTPEEWAALEARIAALEELLAPRGCSRCANWVCGGDGIRCAAEMAMTDELAAQIAELTANAAAVEQSLRDRRSP